MEELGPDTSLLLGCMWAWQAYRLEPEPGSPESGSTPATTGMTWKASMACIAALSGAAQQLPVLHDMRVKCRAASASPSPSPSLADTDMASMAGLLGEWCSACSIVLGGVAATVPFRKWHSVMVSISISDCQPSNSSGSVKTWK
jgi:hypothetical protein